MDRSLPGNSGWGHSQLTRGQGNPLQPGGGGAVHTAPLWAFHIPSHAVPVKTSHFYRSTPVFKPPLVLYGGYSSIYPFTFASELHTLGKKDARHSEKSGA